MYVQYTQQQQQRLRVGEAIECKGAQRKRAAQDALYCTLPFRVCACRCDDWRALALAKRRTHGEGLANLVWGNVPPPPPTTIGADEEFADFLWSGKKRSIAAAACRWRSINCLWVCLQAIGPAPHSRTTIARAMNDALHVACRFQSEECVRMLLDAGAPVNTRYRKSLLCSAVQRSGCGRTDCCHVHNTIHGRQRCDRQAVENSMLVIVEALLAAGAHPLSKIGGRSGAGENALQRVCHHGAREELLCLLGSACVAARK